MLGFQFDGMSYSGKTGLYSYRFSNNGYRCAIYAEKGDGKIKIEYPVHVKAVGAEIDIFPDIRMSDRRAEVSLPPSVDECRLPILTERLAGMPELLEDLKRITREVEDGTYE